MFTCHYTGLPLTMTSPETSSDSPHNNNNLVEGVFSVKLPQNVRCKSSWKVWTTKVVRLEIVKSSWISSKSVDLTVFKSSKSKAVVLREKLNPNRSLVFRCNSRKKPYAFTVYSDGKALVHISGESETESQRFMKSIRNLLSPPNPILELSKALGRVFDVSIIDNERSIRAGLLGAAGNLALTEKKAILSCTRTGQVMQEWYLDTVNFEFLPQKVPVDDSKIVVLVGNKDSSTGQGPIVFYCDNGPILVRQANMIKMHSQTVSSQKALPIDKDLNKSKISPIRAMFQRSAADRSDYDEVPRRQSNENPIISARPLSKDSSGYRTSESLENSFSNSLSCCSCPRNQDFPTSQPLKYFQGPSSRPYGYELSSQSESLLNCSVNLSSQMPERFYANLEISHNLQSGKFLSDAEAHIYEEIKPLAGVQPPSLKTLTRNRISLFSGGRLKTPPQSTTNRTWPKNHNKSMKKDDLLNSSVSEYQINEIDDYCVIEKFDCMNLQSIVPG